MSTFNIKYLIGIGFERGTVKQRFVKHLSAGCTSFLFDIKDRN